MPLGEPRAAEVRLGESQGLDLRTLGPVEEEDPVVELGLEAGEPSLAGVRQLAGSGRGKSPARFTASGMASGHSIA